MRNLLDGLTVTPSLVYPLSRRQEPGAGAGGSQESASRIAALTLRYVPAGAWFASVTLNRYLDRDKRAPWDPDFTYSFGYDDWRPYTFSLVYSNYSNNRFRPRGATNAAAFDHGTWTFGWKFPLPRAVAEPMLIDTKQDIMCRVGYNATPRFDTQAGTEGRWKQFTSLGCRYPVWGNWFIDGAVYRYFQGKQQPWDFDYTYSFGYFDWRSGTVSLQYGNYSGTRFPWRRPSPGTGRFFDGSVTLSWSWTF